jgi:hypothetical protein
MATTQPEHTLHTTGSGIARRTAFGVGLAAVAVLVAQNVVTLLGLDVGPTGAMTPFDPTPLVASAITAGAGAALVYAAVVRFTDRPVRNFLVASVVAFVLSLVPVVTFAPSLGVTGVGQAVLAVYHVVVAVPIVASLVGLRSR